MAAGRTLAPRTNHGDPASSGGRAWRAGGLTPAALFLATALYGLIALAWAASGRGDAAFADASTIAGSAAAAIMLAAAVIAGLLPRTDRHALVWPAVTIGAAALTAAQFASLLVVHGDRAIDWNPWPLRLLAATAPVCLLASLVLRPARIGRWAQDLPSLLTAAIALLGASALLLTAIAVRGADPGSLAASALSLASGVAVIALASTALRRTQNAALLLTSLAWTGAALSAALGSWFDRAGWLSYGRWLLPVGAAGVCVLALSAIRTPSQHIQAGIGSGVLRRLETNEKPVALAGVGGLVASLVLAALVRPPLLWDLAAVGAVMALCAVGWQMSALAAERSLVDELAEVAREWQRVANVDALTALPNRAALLRRLSEEIERSLRYDQPVTVCFIDVDHFKAVNDSHGHAAGDVVLREVGDRLRSSARIIDVVGRYGGEEFLMILPGTWSGDALVVAGRLLEQIRSKPITIGPEGLVTVTISVGIAGVPEHATTLDDLVARADAALYEAKRLGRNRAELFSSTLV